jgi:hypothetical protein
MIPARIGKLSGYLVFRRTYLFTLLFFACLFFYSILDYNNIDLRNFTRGIISIATLDKIDIELRLKIFYRAIFLTAILFVALLAIINILIRKRIISDGFISLLNYISFAGFLGIFLEQSSSCDSKIIYLILVLQSILILHEIFLNKIRNNLQNFYTKDFYLWIGLTAFFMIFPLKTVLLFFNVSHSVTYSFNLLAFTLIFILILTDILLFHFKIQINRLFLLSPALRFFPFVPYISNEIYIILNQHQIELASPKSYNFFLILLLLVYSLILVLNNKQSFKYKSLRYFLAKQYVPYFIAGVTLAATYTALIPQSTEIFELANPANSVMRLFKFGEIPFLQFLSSHFFSEQLFPYLYTLLNGYDGSISFMSYSYLMTIMNSLIVYYFLFYYFRNPYIPLFVVVFFPFTQLVIPFSTSLILISIILLTRIFKYYSIQRLFFYGAWSIFLCFWKPEIGMLNISLSVVFLLIYLIINFNKKLLLEYLKIFTLYSLIIFASFLIIKYLFQVDAIGNVRQALAYLSANQAHGLSALSYRNDRYYFYHYLLIPSFLLVLLLVLIFIPETKVYQKWNNYKFQILIILIVSYIVLAQRGLVRHSLAEGNVMSMSSFFFLISGLTILYFIKDRIQKGILFLITTTLIINNLKYPDSKGYSSVYSDFMNHSNEFEYVQPTRSKIVRVVGQNDFADRNFMDLKQFLDSNISVGSTFYDFSNTPMLYFYTQRRVPSYFNQIPISLNDSALQNANLHELNLMDIPVVIFSNVPENFFDQVDGVPNALRHYVLVQWIYRNYKPFAIINNHTIWLKNDVFLEIEKKNSHILYHGLFKNLPKILDNIESPYIIIKAQTDTDQAFTIKVNGKVLKPFHYEKYTGCEFCFNTEKNKSISIESSKHIEYTDIIAMPYYPDTVSFKPKNYDLKKLAYVIGNYSKIRADKILLLHDSISLYPMDRNYTISQTESLINNRSELRLELEPVPDKMNAKLSYYYGYELKGSFTFDVLPDVNARTYLVPLYVQYNWYMGKFNRLKIQFNSNSGQAINIIKSVSLINEY